MTHEKTPLVATKYGGEKGKTTSMLKVANLSALSVVYSATFADLTAWASVPLQAQDATVSDVDVKHRLQRVDLSGVN